MGSKRIIYEAEISAKNSGELLAELEKHKVIDLIVAELKKMIEMQQNENKRKTNEKD